MPGSFLTDDLDTMFDTDELAETCSYNEQSFGVHFFLENQPSDMFDNIVENAQAYMIARTSDIADIKHGALVEIGAAPDDDAGSGLAGTGLDSFIIDSEDTTFSTSGIYQLYAIKIMDYGDDGLLKQIFLSKDRP